ncbi:MAG: peptide chain release factor-like protein [Thermoguttaceae bacterium]|nr:peptide chain release factor-like protein [Thermoguttaceae bacterium]MDW8078698.1 peptide chain release factor-like protein [Thermoguttaceae bacterium]
MSPGADPQTNWTTPPESALHPAFLTGPDLLAQCRVERLRRRGPGGQHRNKVETGIRLLHVPTGVMAEADERRSQAENQSRALWRLRLKLALQVRRPCGFYPLHPNWAKHLQQGKIRLNPEHEDFPSLLADLLDRISWDKGEIRPVAQSLGSTPSQIISLLRKEPAALSLVNSWRASVGKSALR